MAKLLKLRRGTTSQHSSFTGAEGEVTVDTDKETLVVHNGSTAGGFPLARADHPDNQKTRWGTGNDLEIFHDTNNAVIRKSTAGDLYLETTSSADDIIIKATDDIALKVKGNEDGINVKGDGAVELFHNNVKKFQTDSAGASLFGNLYQADDDKLILGTDSDLQIYHNGTNAYFLNSTGNVIITNMDPDDNNNIHLRARQNEDNIVCYNDASTDIYYNGAKKFETTAGGSKVTGRLEATGGFFVGDGGDNDTSVSIGASNDLRLYHDGSNSYIKDRGTGELRLCGNVVKFNNAANTETMVEATENSGVRLYNDNSQRLITTSTGLEMRGSSTGFYGVMSTNDGNNRGYLHANSSETVGLLDDQQHWLLNGTKNGGNNLYYDNSKKFETKSTGAEIYGNLEFGDNKYAYFGNSDDLRIYHNGTNSFVENTTEVGHLFLRNNGPVDKNIYIQARAGEDSITCENDGAVNLYFNNLKKLETWNDGIIVRGREGSMGGVDIYADEGDNNADKWRLKANNAGEFQLQNYSTGAWQKNINVSGNAQTELYYGNNIKFETTTGGAKITGNGIVTNDFLVDSDSGRIKLGLDEDIQFYHNGSHSMLIHNGAGHFYIKTEGADEDLVINAERNAYIQCSAGEHGVICKEDSEVELYYNNAVKFETRGFGCRTFGHLGVNVDPGNTPNTRNAFVAIGDSDTGVAQNGDGQLELWANNQEIMNIDTGEVTFYKPAIPSANNTHDLGSTSYRWRNLYVNDAHFSNEGSSNSVDGTWGDWTLQEGEDNIFMLNNRTGKKYKMNLTEVS